MFLIRITTPAIVDGVNSEPGAVATEFFHDLPSPAKNNLVATARGSELNQLFPAVRRVYGCFWAEGCGIFRG